MIKDYYKLLGISNEATLKEIKKAFRRFALQYHPDRNKDENTGLKFIEITEAYEVLKDPSKRAEYDRLYTIYILNQSEPESQDSDSDFTNKWESSFNEWADFGRQKAKEYSSLSIEDLARRLIKEIGVGVSYLPNMIAILFSFGCMILLLLLILVIPEGTPFFLLMASACGYLTYKLTKVALDDYQEDRKRKL